MWMQTHIVKISDSFICKWGKKKENVQKKCKKTVRCLVYLHKKCIKESLLKHHVAKTDSKFMKRGQDLLLYLSVSQDDISTFICLIYGQKQ